MAFKPSPQTSAQLATRGLSRDAALAALQIAVAQEQSVISAHSSPVDESRIVPPVVTPITVNPTYYVSSNGLGYWKDIAGNVHMKGRVQPVALYGDPWFTFPLGFRPYYSRTYLCWGTGSVPPIGLTVDSTGGLYFVGNYSGGALVVGQAYDVSPICFQAEQ